MAPLELVTNLATRCHHLYWFQIWPLDDYLQIWPPDGTTCITNKFAHQTKSHALPDCLGLPYWHYQLVLTWYLHQPESHQLSFKNVSYVLTDNRTLRSDQGYLGPIKTVLCGKNSHVGSPPPLPQYGNFFDEMPFFFWRCPKTKKFKIVKYVF